MGKFNYEWKLSETIFTKDKGDVFSCYACGGGSTFGYKLSGFDVIGCNEIDPRMNKVYVENHHPKINYLCDIRSLLTAELDERLYNLTIFDGSPPCSSFSMGGSREKGWGKSKKFKEGQTDQVLDTLFFDTISLIKRLQPKVALLENVEAMMFGEAKEYVKEIYRQLDDAGYYTQHVVLSSENMGVPQRRSRIFFIALRKDLRVFIKERDVDIFNQSPYLDLRFNEPEIIFDEIEEVDFNRETLSEKEKIMWNGADETGYYKVEKTGNTFGFFYKGIRNRAMRTIMAGGCYSIESYPEKINRNEIVKCTTFPLDYNFLDQDPQYICGMSVPPVMVAQISLRIYDSWLQYIPKT